MKQMPSVRPAGDLNGRSRRRPVRKIDPCPTALAHKYENGEDHGSSDQQECFGLWIIVPVRGMLASIFSVSRDEKGECSLNENEGYSANDEHCHEKAVNLAAVLGSQSRKPIRLRNEEIK